WSQHMRGLREEGRQSLRLQHPDSTRGTGPLLDEPTGEHHDRTNGHPLASAVGEQATQPPGLSQRLHRDAIVWFPTAYGHPRPVEHDPSVPTPGLRPGLSLHREHARRTDQDVVDVEAYAN